MKTIKINIVLDCKESPSVSTIISTLEDTFNFDTIRRVEMKAVSSSGESEESEFENPMYIEED